MYTIKDLFSNYWIATKIPHDILLRWWQQKLFITSSYFGKDSIFFRKTKCFSWCHITFL